MKVSPSVHKELALAREEAERFGAALGAFVLAWSDVELELYHVLVHYAGVSDGVARSIFSGTRARTMTDYINNIAHNTKVAKGRRENLAAVFAQMNHINFMRDKVIHYASGNSYGFNEPTTRALTNHARVNRYEAHFVYEIGSKHLKQMTEDLYLIGHHLQMHRSGSASGFVPWQEEPADGTAWRYKPLTPAAKKSKRKP